MKYTNKSSIEALIEGCRNGSPLAQEQLYKRYYGKMMVCCMKYASNRDEALEMLNTGFLKVFKSIGKYGEKGSFEGWVKRIMINTSIDYLRKYKMYHSSVNASPDVDGSVTHTALDELMLEDLMQVIGHMPTINRTVFSLYFVDGYSHKEIGEMLEIPVGTSKWYLSEAKAIFKKLVSTYYRDKAVNE